MGRKPVSVGSAVGPSRLLAWLLSWSSPQRIQDRQFLEPGPESLRDVESGSTMDPGCEHGITFNERLRSSRSHQLNVNSLMSSPRDRKRSAGNVPLISRHVRGSPPGYLLPPLARLCCCLARLTASPASAQARHYHPPPPPGRTPPPGRHRQLAGRCFTSLALLSPLDQRERLGPRCLDLGWVTTPTTGESEGERSSQCDSVKSYNGFRNAHH
jgi:hypothetical protein